jgi:hypothetical protein
MLAVLAQPAASNAPATTQPLAWTATLTLPSHWPAQGDLLEWCEQLSVGTSALLLVAGVVYLLWGYQWFKPLVMLNAALCGAWIGAMLGQQIARAPVPAAFIGGFVAASITWPLMRWAVAIMGALFGFILGVSMWRASGLDAAFAPSGGAIGMVFFGMLSFILFRGSVMMFTSIQGAAMLILALLSFTQKYQALGTSVQKGLMTSPVLLPMLVFVPAVIGLIYQQSAGEADPKKK